MGTCACRQRLMAPHLALTTMTHTQVSKQITRLLERKYCKRLLESYFECY